MWVRGLKPRSRRFCCRSARRTPCGCVDWNMPTKERREISDCRTPCGCVDWNLYSSMCTRASLTSHPTWVHGLKHEGSLDETLLGRTSCGCVDWNHSTMWAALIPKSRTPCGCVDWNQLVSKCKIEHCGYCYTWAELSIFLVPIGALWWYRFMRYSGTDLPILSKTLAKSVYFSLFNSEIEWNIRENL